MATTAVSMANAMRSKSQDSPLPRDRQLAGLEVRGFATGSRQRQLCGTITPRQLPYSITDWCAHLDCVPRPVTTVIALWGRCAVPTLFSYTCAGCTVQALPVPFAAQPPALLRGSCTRLQAQIT